jgi:hypothetical protein
VKLTNHSGFPASLTRSQLLYRDLMLATVVVKASFEVQPDGVVTRVPTEAQLPVSEADVTTEFGSIDGDVVPIKPACDVAVLGHARSPRADQPVDRLQLELRVGSFARSVMVIGDRTWIDATPDPRPSAPRPFTTIPLTYDRAYGGSTLAYKQLEAPFAQNPDGRGFLRLREHAAGTPLPNLEEPDQLVKSWEDTPLPAGMAPLPRKSSLRFEGGGFEVDLANELLQLTPAAFSFAHPRMRMSRYEGGQVVELAGAAHGAPWKFQLPSLTFTAVINLGDRCHELPLTIDTLCLFPDHRRFFVGARRACIYELRPARPRSFAVFAGPPSHAHGAGGPGTTVGEQRRAPAPVVPIVSAMKPDAAPLPFESLLSIYPMTRLLEELPLLASG